MVVTDLAAVPKRMRSAPKVILPRPDKVHLFLNREGSSTRPEKTDEANADSIVELPAKEQQTGKTAEALLAKP